MEEFEKAEDWGTRKKTLGDYLMLSALGQIHRHRKAADERDAAFAAASGDDLRPGGSNGTGVAFGRGGHLRLPERAGASYARQIASMRPGEEITHGHSSALSQWTSSGAFGSRDGFHPAPFVRMRASGRTGRELRPGEIETLAEGTWSFGANPRGIHPAPSRVRGGSPVRFVRGMSPNGEIQYALHMPDQVTSRSPKKAPAPLERDDMSPAQAEELAYKAIREHLTQGRFTPGGDYHIPANAGGSHLSELLRVANSPYTDVQLIKRRDGVHHAAFPSNEMQEAFPVQQDGRGPRTHIGVALHPDGSVVLHDASRNASNFVHVDPTSRQVGSVDSTGGLKSIHTNDKGLYANLGDKDGTFAPAMPDVAIHPDAVRHRDALVAKTAAMPPEARVGHDHTGARISMHSTAKSFFLHATYPHEAGIKKAAIGAVGKVQPVPRIIGSGSQHPDRPPVEKRPPAPKRDGNTPPPTVRANRHPGGGEAPKMGDRLAPQASIPPSPSAPVLKPVAPGQTAGRIGTIVNTRA